MSQQAKKYTLVLLANYHNVSFPSFRKNLLGKQRQSIGLCHSDFQYVYFCVASLLVPADEHVVINNNWMSINVMKKVQNKQSLPPAYTEP